MKTLNLSKFILKTIIIGTLTSNVAVASNKVIYGEDNRSEVNDHHSSMLRKLSQSVAGQVNEQNLLILDDENYTYLNRPLFSIKDTRQKNICEFERFATQTALPQCTGFLVAKDILVTAGHCVTKLQDCENFRWVFNYSDDSGVIPKSNVFSCKEVIGRKQTLGIFATKDYAIIKLDRPVSGRAPLKLKMRGNPDEGDRVAVIGHPSGLPMKITDNGEIVKKKFNFFYTNLDAYGGNSGSPVFDQNNGEVLGILIQGANDYIWSLEHSCKVSNRLRNDWGKEKVFKIKKIKELKKLIP